MRCYWEQLAVHTGTWYKLTLSHDTHVQDVRLQKHSSLEEEEEDSARSHEKPGP